MEIKSDKQNISPELTSNKDLSSASAISNQRGNSLIIIGVVVLLLVLIAGGFLLLKNAWLKTPEDQRALVPNLSTDYRLTDEKILVNFGIGFWVGLDKKWDVEIVEKDQKHIFLKAKENSGARLEIETFSHSLKNWQNYIKNPLLEVEQTESRTIGENQVKVERGKEVFAKSKTRSVAGTWEMKEKTLVIRSGASSQSLAEETFNRIAETVSYSDNKVSLVPLGAKEAFAAEDTVPSGLPKIEYKQIEIMAPLLKDEITKTDTPYKDGYAKGYKFLAFKSQRLTAVAFEVKESNTNSYIHSQIFDANGNEVSKEKDTRIEFQAPYSGEYFLVVSTFNRREGEIQVGLDDRDQTEVKNYTKYPDGTDSFLDMNDPGSILVGASEVGLIIQIPNPITIINDKSFEYDHRLKEFEPIYGRVTSQIEVFLTPDAYKSKGLQNFFKHIEEEEKYKIKFKMVQVGANRLLITPVDGLFPKNHQVVMTESTEGIIRFFTQNKAVINLLILQQISEDYPKDFEPLAPSYFDWVLPDGKMIEILGGWLQGSKPQDETQYNQIKQYLTDKGYLVDERNLNVALPPYTVNNAIKKSVGFVKENTVCRLEYIGSLNVYCGNPP